MASGIGVSAHAYMTSFKWDTAIESGCHIASSTHFPPMFFMCANARRKKSWPPQVTGSSWPMFWTFLWDSDIH